MKRSKPMKRTALKRGTKRLKAKGGTRFKSYAPNPEYQAWIREQGCALRGFRQCYGNPECDHITTRGAGGSDEGNLWPLCTQHHAERHATGIKSFAAKYGVDPKAVAVQLWAEYERERGLPTL